MFISRDRRPAENMGVRMVLFTIGAGVALLGMSTGRRWLIWISMVILLAAFLVRFAASRPSPGEESDSSSPRDPE